MRPLVRVWFVTAMGTGRPTSQREVHIREVNSSREELALEAASYYMKTEEQNVAPTPRNLSLENVKKMPHISLQEDKVVVVWLHN